MGARKSFQVRMLQDDLWSEEGESGLGVEAERGVRRGDEDIICLWCLYAECVVERERYIFRSGAVFVYFESIKENEEMVRPLGKDPVDGCDMKRWETFLRGGGSAMGLCEGGIERGWEKGLEVKKMHGAHAQTHDT